MKKISPKATNPQVSGVIDRGCSLEGKLHFYGTLQMGGSFRGEIYTPDVLVVSEGGKVDGKVDAGVVIIHGEVSGTVKAMHRVEIHKPAVFRGEIITPSLKVEEGVIFEGKNQMLSESQAPVSSYLDQS